jgi:hypothetical protein
MRKERKHYTAEVGETPLSSVADSPTLANLLHDFLGVD